MMRQCAFQEPYNDRPGHCVHVSGVLSRAVGGFHIRIGMIIHIEGSLYIYIY